jgi:antiviral helicase SLH1
MPHDEPKDDPNLGNKRNELIVQAARQLSAAKMIRFDEISNSFQISDLGRIAAKYYLRYQTMEVFSALSRDEHALSREIQGLTADTMFHPKMKNADLFAMLSQATEVGWHVPYEL